MSLAPDVLSARAELIRLRNEAQSTERERRVYAVVRSFSCIEAIIPYRFLPEPCSRVGRFSHALGAAESVGLITKEVRQQGRTAWTIRGVCAHRRCRLSIDDARFAVSVAQSLLEAFSKVCQAGSCSMSPSAECAHCSGRWCTSCATHAIRKCRSCGSVVCAACCNLSTMGPSGAPATVRSCPMCDTGESRISARDTIHSIVSGANQSIPRDRGNTPAEERDVYRFFPGGIEVFRERSPEAIEFEASQLDHRSEILSEVHDAMSNLAWNIASEVSTAALDSILTKNCPLEVEHRFDRALEDAVGADWYTWIYVGQECFAFSLRDIINRRLE